ncbi:MAG: N-formylglutamate amidohydrolase [Rhodobacteraceae bacterium]|nr:N-formylglutamate amidohydrolase [Paracoccaceae bacterium]
MPNQHDDTDALSAGLLSAAEGAAYEVVNASGCGPIVLVCEHASPMIPAALNGLGLDELARSSHAAWDIGAFAVALRLSALFDAPLVASRVSRLVYDCNRAPGAPGAITPKSEIYDVPGNVGLSAAATQLREVGVYHPFRRALERTLAGSIARAAQADAPPVILVTMHSFTPVYYGVQRKVELGVLHGQDDRLAQTMLPAAQASGWAAELNAPYGPTDGVSHTLDIHGAAGGVLNVMFELRNDLISDEAGCDAAAQMLHSVIASGLPAVAQESQAKRVR